MGVRRGDTCSPLEFEKVTSYAAVLQNTLKFSIDTLYFSLKRSENPNVFRLRLRRAEKWLFFCPARQKRVSFLKY